MNELGTFNVTSSKLMVTDPCYERGTWCAGMLENVKNGVWTGFVVRVEDELTTYDGRVHKGITVAELVAFHSSVDSNVRWIKSKIDVGVDSGQAGIFDEAKYPHGKNEPERMKEYNSGKFNAEFEKFYEECGLKTLGVECSESYYANDPNFKRAGVVFDMGIVSGTAYGDGSYTCYTATREGEIVAVKIVYMDKADRGRELLDGEVVPKPMPREDHMIAYFKKVIADGTHIHGHESEFLKFEIERHEKKVKEVEDWNKANVRMVK